MVQMAGLEPNKLGFIGLRVGLLEANHMRDLFKEYRLGLISWEEAFITANNLSANSSISAASYEETDYWASKLERLSFDISEQIIARLGYVEDNNGLYHKD